MADARSTRLAKNEAMFRSANERMKDWDELHADGNEELYFCECADTECREKVSLARSDYERVRSDSRHFAVVTGHVVPDIETVIDTHDGWVVIEKAANVTSLVEGLDSRDKTGDAPRA